MKIKKGMHFGVRHVFWEGWIGTVLKKHKDRGKIFVQAIMRKPGNSDEQADFGVNILEF